MPSASDLNLKEQYKKATELAKSIVLGSEELHDKRSFGVPFIEIHVGKKYNDLIELPPHILRFVEKVEIQQTVEYCTFNQGTITFVEGAREPYSQTEVSSNNLYPGLTNQIGALADLKFNSLNTTQTIPFTNLKLEDVKNAVAKGKQALDLVTNLVKGDIDFGTLGSYKQSPYVFHADNWIKVVWGYKDFSGQKSLLINSMTGIIRIVEYTFGNSEAPKFTVVFQDFGSLLETINTLKPFSVSKDTIDGFSSRTGKPLISKDVENESVEDFVAEVADYLGADYVVSIDNVPIKGDEISRYKNSGLNWYQYLNNFARVHNCIFSTVIVGDTPTIFLVNKNNYFQTEIINRDLLIYRGQYSILKSVNIRADYGIPTGSTATTINDAGKLTNTTVYTAEVTGENGSKLADPKSGGNLSDTNNLNTAFGYKHPSSNVHIVAGKTGKDYQRTINDTITYNQQNCMLVMECELVGYPLIHPGLVYIDNISERYSGLYKILNATHIIEPSSGYTTKLIGQSSFSKDGKLGATTIPTSKASSEDIVAKVLNQAER